MSMSRGQRTNRERSEATRAALLGAARTLFIEKGYGGTSTPEVVAQAKVTRGALYHHFADKTALFRAVIEAEAQAVAAEIDGTTEDSTSPAEALTLGTKAYFRAMAAAGRARLLLIEGPAVLGPQDMARIDRTTGGEALRAGLDAALAHLRLSAPVLTALAHVLSAAFDRAALAIAQGEPASPYEASIALLVWRLSASAD